MWKLQKKNDEIWIEDLTLNNNTTRNSGIHSFFHDTKIAVSYVIPATFFPHLGNPLLTLLSHRSVFPLNNGGEMEIDNSGKRKFNNNFQSFSSNSVACNDKSNHRNNENVTSLTNCQCTWCYINFGSFVTRKLVSGDCASVLISRSLWSQSFWALRSI